MSLLVWESRRVLFALVQKSVVAWVSGNVRSEKRRRRVNGIIGNGGMVTPLYFITNVILDETFF